MDKKFKDNLYTLLKNDSRLWSEDGKELNQTLLKDLVDKFDEKIIESLLGNAETKKQFFVKIKEAYVFKPSDFKFFLDENKIDNSFTQLANIIGLKIEDDKNDKVILNWPFKDCVLEGGMTKEDSMDAYFKYDKESGGWKEQKAKRKEIFFNEVLARDEIDRLEEPKAFYKWERFTAKGGEKVKEIKRNQAGLIKENFVIKGNNLLALHSLKNQFEGKVKLIYIDPPYNTGTDSFAYNDNFNHSSWLTFMKNRLEVARDLLSIKGNIFVQIDANEGAYLKVLLDSIFGRENFRNQITWLRSSSGKTVSRNLSEDTDYILWYSKTSSYDFDKVFKPLSENTKLMYNKNDNDGRGVYRLYPLQKTGSPGPETIYDYKDNSGKIWKCPKKGWRMNKNKLKDLENDERLYMKGNSLSEKAYWDERENEGQIANNLWNDIPNLQGSNKEKIDFGGQKPENLLKRIIDMTTKEGEIVLDYHAGSGTTCAVAHKMNRQWIGVEQLDYSENNPEERMKGVIAGDKTGISKKINWKGGGDFIYIQLAKWNEEAREKITETNSYEELVRLFSGLSEKYFLSYNVRVKDFKEIVIKSEEFKNISLTEQKKMFVRMLDLNQMYVNFSERDDKKYNLAKEDIALSENFYKHK